MYSNPIIYNSEIYNTDSHLGFLGVFFIHTLRPVGHNYLELLSGLKQKSGLISKALEGPT